MTTDIRMIGEKIYLRQIIMDDCNERYVAWLNDPEVNQYLETKWSEQDIDAVRLFVKTQMENVHSVLFAIVNMDNDLHIGNIKIGPVHSHYKHADISYFIGEKTYWNKGIVSEAINLVCQFGFVNLNLHRIEAGAYECAIGSWKALEKCNFKREGVFRKQVFFNNEYIDIYRYGLLKEEYKKKG